MGSFAGGAYVATLFTIAYLENKFHIFSNQSLTQPKPRRALFVLSLLHVAITYERAIFFNYSFHSVVDRCVSNKRAERFIMADAGMQHSRYLLTFHETSLLRNIYSVQ